MTRGEKDHKMIKKLQLPTQENDKGEQNNKMTNQCTWPCSLEKTGIECQMIKNKALSFATRAFWTQEWMKGNKTTRHKIKKQKEQMQKQ
jgi:hypothetical protein